MGVKEAIRKRKGQVVGMWTREPSVPVPTPEDFLNFWQASKRRIFYVHNKTVISINSNTKSEDRFDQHDIEGLALELAKYDSEARMESFNERNKTIYSKEVEKHYLEDWESVFKKMKFASHPNPNTRSAQQVYKEHLGEIARIAISSIKLKGEDWQKSMVFNAGVHVRIVCMLRLGLIRIEDRS